MFRKLAYFEFSSSEVARKQFTLNNVYQSGGSTSTSKSAKSIDEPEVARVCMQMLEDGEEYIQRHLHTTHEEDLVMKPLKLPTKCKLTEGFITLFDDFALHIPFKLAPNETSKWHHFLNKNANKNSKALWTRLWFKVEIINDPNAQKDDDEDYNPTPNKEVIYPQTVILKYWLYPEHAEQDQEPVGIIDLSGCLPLIRTTMSERFNMEIIPAARPVLDSSVRPNTMRLQFTTDYQIQKADNNPTVYEPVLLALDTPDERDEWCNTINGAVDAIAVHQSQFIEYHQLTTEKK